MKVQFEWNFIFLIYANLITNLHELGTDGEKLLDFKEEIINLPIPENYNLYIIENIVVLDVSRTLQKDYFICYEVKNNSLSTFADIRFAEKILEKPMIIGNILKEINEKTDAKKSILFTIDHGNGFGINRIPHFIKNLQRNKELTKLFQSKNQISSLERHFDYSNYYANPPYYRKSESSEISFSDLVKENDHTKLKPIFRKTHFNHINQFFRESKSYKFMRVPVIDLLTNEMLADAISLGFNKRKIDILCMMNCCMQNLHTQYAFRNNIKYLIAPQTWIYYPGYNYERIFNILNIYPQLSAKMLSKLIIETFHVEAKQKIRQLDNLPELGIFSMRLKYVSIIFTLLKIVIKNEIRLQFKKEYKNNNRYLYRNKFYEYERDVIEDYRFIDLYDLYQFRQNSKFIKSYFSTLVIKLFYCLFQVFIKEGDFIGMNLASNSLVKKTTGIMISFPKEKVFNNNADFILLFIKESSYQSVLCKSIHWAQFLKAIYES